MPLNERAYESVLAAVAVLRSDLDDPDRDEGFAPEITRSYTDKAYLTVDERLNGAMTLASYLLLRLEEAGHRPEAVLQEAASGLRLHSY